VVMDLVVCEEAEPVLRLLESVDQPAVPVNQVMA